MTFLLRRRGSEFPTFRWLLWAFFGGVFALGTVAGAVATVVHDPGPGEGGRGVGLAFTMFVGSVACLAGVEARRGVPLALASYRRPGAVTIEGDLLRIDAPGLVTRPVELHRSLIDRVDRPKRRVDHDLTWFTLRQVTRPIVLRLRHPVAIPQATDYDEPFGPFVDWPSSSDTAVAVALDIDQPEEALELIAAWANGLATTPAPAPPSPVPKDNGRLNRNLLLLAIGTGAFIAWAYALPA